MNLRKFSLLAAASKTPAQQFAALIHNHQLRDAESMLKVRGWYPLILQSVSSVDGAGRAFNGFSGLQCALWSFNARAVAMMMKYMPVAEANLTCEHQFMLLENQSRDFVINMYDLIASFNATFREYEFAFKECMSQLNAKNLAITWLEQTLKDEALPEEDREKIKHRIQAIPESKQSILESLEMKRLAIGQAYKRLPIHFVIDMIESFELALPEVEKTPMAHLLDLLSPDSPLGVSFTLERFVLSGPRNALLDQEAEAKRLYQRECYVADTFQDHWDAKWKVIIKFESPKFNVSLPTSKL